MDWLGRLCKKAGVKPFGFHGMRHLFASILAAQNVPFVEIQYMLRHTSLATTQRCIHRLKKENREVLAALPGLTDSEKSTSKVTSTM
jgi:integrase